MAEKHPGQVILQKREMCNGVLVNICLGIRTLTGKREVISSTTIPPPQIKQNSQIMCYSTGKINIIK